MTSAARLLYLLVVLHVAVGCARTRVTRVRDPDYLATSFRSPAIYADIVDLQQRQLVEEAMVQELGRLGVSARTAINLIPPTRNYVPEERLTLLRGAGIDSLVVVAAESGVTHHYVPIRRSSPAAPSARSHQPMGPADRAAPRQVHRDRRRGTQARRHPVRALARWLDVRAEARQRCG